MRREENRSEVKDSLLGGKKGKGRTFDDGSDEGSSEVVIPSETVLNINAALGSSKNNVVPSDTSSWRLQPEVFERGIKSTDEMKSLPKKSKNFYKQQNELVESFFNLEQLHKPYEGDEDADDQKEEAEDRKVKIAIYGSFAVNIALFCLKVYASIASGSMSVLASALDSFLDLLSGSIIFLTNYFISKKNVYKYPAGKERLEPLGLIVFSACMFTATLQLLTSSVNALVTKSEIDLSFGSLLVIVSTVISKFTLWMYCRLLKGSASVATLAQDHRNDVISNTFGVTTALIGNYALWWIDPIGGILIGLYIMTNWFRTGYELVQNLTGKSAPSSFLQQLTYVSWNHDSRIIKIDTVRAFHLGLGFMVEVDIVLPEDMPLKEAHDIGEELQKKLEQLSVVERAFVHLDYDYGHQPEHRPRKKLDLVELED